MKIKLLIFIFTFFSFGFLSSQTTESLKKEADSLFYGQNYKKAIELYTQLILKQPKNYENYYDRANCYLYSKHYNKAIDDINKGLGLNPSLYYKSSFYNLKGYCFYYKDEFLRATEFLTKHIELNYDSYDSYLMRGDCLYRQKKHLEAISDFRYALKNPEIKNEDASVAIASIGFCFLDEGKVVSARKISDSLKTINGGYYRGKFLEGQISIAEKKYTDAISIFKFLYIKDSSYTEMIEKIGICYYYMGKYDSAIVNYKKALLFDSKSSYLNNQISWNYFLNKEFKTALPFANKAILLDSKSGAAYDTRGCVHYKLNNYIQAISDFNQSIKNDSTTLNSYYYRGWCYYKTNQKQLACKDWFKIKSFTPLEGEEPVSLLLSKYCNK